MSCMRECCASISCRVQSIHDQFTISLFVLQCTHTSVFGSSSSSRSGRTSAMCPPIHIQHPILRTLIRSNLVYRRRILVFIVRILQRFRVRQHRLFLTIEPQLSIPARTIAMRAGMLFGCGGFQCVVLLCCGGLRYGCFWHGGAVAGFGHGGCCVRCGGLSLWCVGGQYKRSQSTCLFVRLQAECDCAAQSKIRYAFPRDARSTRVGCFMVGLDFFGGLLTYRFKNINNILWRSTRTMNSLVLDFGDSKTPSSYSYGYGK